MGSIQVFPRRPSAHSAQAWRKPQRATGGTVRVREARLEDFAAVRGLQRHSGAHLPAWTLKQFESRRTAFAEGQMVAEYGGEIAGVASALVVPWNDYGIDHTLKEITAEGLLTTHDASGGTLYGAELFVEDSGFGFAAARALQQARRRLCRRRNLRRIITTARLANYRDERERLTPEGYAMRVIWGELSDPWLRLHFAQGFQYCGIAHGFAPEDAASGGHAALLAWINPLYAPPGPPAFVQSNERARKCA